jgi:hypothetical protein
MSVTENKTSTVQAKEPMFEVAQLAHVELLTPQPDETLRRFLVRLEHVPPKTVDSIKSYFRKLLPLPPDSATTTHNRNAARNCSRRRREASRSPAINLRF